MVSGITPVYLSFCFHRLAGKEGVASLCYILHSIFVEEKSRVGPGRITGDTFDSGSALTPLGDVHTHVRNRASFVSPAH